ncbi:MAG: GNAT family N-acetyltransferase [Caldilinea sp. CFX5]|nr:GNAT family N-acetyltransferase [Caldilinea sp. CFX5]
MATEFAASGDTRYQAALTDFVGYLQLRQRFARGENLPPDRVRETTYWGVEGDMIVGTARVRHTLTPALEELGGHIGYDVRPSQRRQGYGTALLGGALERARHFGLTGVLVTCDTDNIGSARVIVKNGGQLINQTMVDGYAKLISRYWIDLHLATVPSNEAQPRRSLSGALAPLGPAPSAAEIDQARTEAWANFPREDAKE